MICKRCLSGISTVCLLLAVSPASSEEVAAPPEFTYTDDWSLVSAPPPPGPYSAIHIDPRVPGQDSLPPLPGGQPPQLWEEVEEKTAATPPGAGVPDTASRDEPVQQMPGRHVRPQTRMRPQQPAYRYPVPGHYPGRSNYPAYRDMPPQGYYGSVPYPSQTEEVPPPPVYEDMMRRSGPTW